MAVYIGENQVGVTRQAEVDGATAVPTPDKIAKFNPTARMNSADMSSQEVENFIDSLDLNRNMLDFFYPVGTYYETSDSSFNPNIHWGGSWEAVTKHDPKYNGAENVTLAANTDTCVATISLDAGVRYLVVGSTGTGQGASQTSNSLISLVSGTATVRRFITNSVTASSGSNLTSMAEVITSTECTVGIYKYNYTSSAITTGNGHLSAFPLTDYNDGKYKWRRFA